jgi:broad specificity phosphatase PhoE
MRIGLIRHFPVEQALPSGWKTAAELSAWRVQYDLSPTIPGPLDLGSHPWSDCLSSDLERTAVTAKAAFAGTIEFTPLLREPEIAEFQTGGLRLPIGAWRWMLRLAWMTGHRSQRTSRNEFRTRVSVIADMLEKRDADILVVSHAGMMAYLSAELRARGYTGPTLRIPKHARLYVYEKKPARTDPRRR